METTGLLQYCATEGGGSGLNIYVYVIEYSQDFGQQCVAMLISSLQAAISACLLLYTHYNIPTKNIL